MGMCKDCKHGNGLTLEEEKQSILVQKQIASLAGIGGEAKTKKIEEIVAENENLRKVHGGLSLSMKPTDVDGTYVVCSNKDQLAFEKAKEAGIIHKYYFSCPFFEAVK
jgi:hypothetical protein